MNEVRPIESDAEFYRRAQELFDVLVELEPDSRRARLQLECGDDDRLRGFVERLLRADAGASETDTERSDSSLSAGGLRRADASDLSSDEDPNSNPEIGDRLGRYVILQLIGRGGMGMVYVAYDPELERRVALKLLHAGRNRPRAHARLQREAKAMAQVSHANVVPIFDVGTFGERVFIAMEYVEGATLREWTLGRRDWRATIKVFLDAGRGLQAAHEAGLVHRDFKPDNVLVTTSGRAKVTDFGLVRATETEDREQTLESSSADDDGSLDSEALNRLATPLTRAGTIMGTPGYMSPEQFRGDTADAHSDQFAFCTALYEALWRESPFPGHNFAEIREQVLLHKPITIPRGRGVPSWLAEVIIRGLEYNPGMRWPSMAALLQALQDDPSQRRRVRFGVAVGVGLIAAAGLGLWVDERRAVGECEARGAAIEGQWNLMVRGDTRAAILATELDFAEDTATRVEAGLDAWVANWREARVEACMDQRSGEALAEASGRCLDTQLEAFGGLLDVFAESDRSTVVRAMKSVVELPRLEACKDPTLLAIHEDPVPDDTQKLLSRVRSLSHAGRYDEALATGERLLEDPAVATSTTLRIRARLALGHAQHGGGSVEREQALAEDAYYEAARIGHDPLALSASLVLIGNATDQAELEAAKRWARQAESLSHRLGNKPIDLAKLHARRGWMSMKFGALPKAETELRLAVELYEQVHGGEDPVHAVILADLAKLLIERQRFDEAHELLTRSKELTIASVGVDHPDVARLELTEGELETRRGNFGVARPLLERSLATLERVYAPDESIVIAALNSLAILETDSGDHARALELIERAIETKQRSGGEDKYLIGIFSGNAAVMQQGLGLYDEARANYELAMTLLADVAGPDSPLLGMFHGDLGDLLIEFGEYDAAREHLVRSIAIHDAALGPNSPDTVIARADLGDLQCRQGELQEGRKNLERALRSGEEGIRLHARVHFVLARCHVAAGSEAEALAAIAQGLKIINNYALPGTIDLAEYLSEAVAIQLELGRPDLALDRARTVFAIIASQAHASPLLRAQAKLNLARALAGVGLEPERAEALVVEVRAELEAAGMSPFATKTLEAELDAWAGE